MVRRLCHFIESENLLLPKQIGWLVLANASWDPPGTDQWSPSPQAPIVLLGHPASQDVRSTRRLLTKPRQPGRGRARARGR